METLDSLLESIAFENFTTSIHMAGLMNGDAADKANLTSNNNNINHKTDTLNRYFDNLINFNRECEKANTRKSESSSDHSSSSDQQQYNGRMPYQQVEPSLIHFIVNVIMCALQALDLSLQIIFAVNFTRASFGADLEQSLIIQFLFCLFFYLRIVTNQFHRIVRKPKLKFLVQKRQLFR